MKHACASAEYLDPLHEARTVIRHEANALCAVSLRLDEQFCAAIDLIVACTGNVIVTGMGKAGLVGRKISATLSSTGTRSQFLHPAEAIHGDLGCLDRQDVSLILSNSGETEEIVRLLESLIDLEIPIIAITRDTKNTLARAANIVVRMGKLHEADGHGLAPSTTTTAMLAIGDALALVSSRQKGFRPTDFAKFHPGGSLGRRLRPVTEVMRPLDECRVASENQTVREVVVQTSRPGRRSGAIMLTNQQGHLAGIFTDSDLAKLFEACDDGALDQPIRQVMFRSPTTVHDSATSDHAIDILAQHKISELPVIDAGRRPVGMIDVTDVMTWLPANEGPRRSPRQIVSPAAPATIPLPPRDATHSPDSR